MNHDLQAIMASKRRERNRLAHLPISEKLAILERLRDRAMAIAESPLARRRGTHRRAAW